MYRSEMNTKLSVLLFLCILKCRLALTAANLRVNSTDDDTIFKDCAISANETGYCVQIYECLPLFQTMNETLFNQRKCGPSNENRKTPKICCEPHFVQQASETTEPPTPPPITCGVPNVTTPSRIFGGEEALPGEFPWMARLLRRNRDDDFTFSCSGALISSKVVLTAAHCLVSPNLQSFGSLDSVVLGEHEIECGFGDVKCIRHKKQAVVADTIAHPKYKINSRNHDNDVGLIILKDEVEFTNFITPICVLEDAYEASYYYISGWGVTEHGGMSNVKIKTTLPPYSWNQCVDKFKTISVVVTSHQICAGGVKGQDSCQGDSGGPLMASRNGIWYAAGLVSYGLGCGREGWPAIYTNVPTYSDWIKRKIANT